MTPKEHRTDDVPVDAPKRGDVIAEKYRVEGVLGVGGMGYVLAATHLQLEERVAIKMLLPERAKDPETVARFLREGRAAVRIRSEHVARVLDVGSVGSTPHIVMEYLDGSDLSTVLRERQRLPVPVAVDYLLQACEAIAEAHAMQTVHRDLKPANLFLVKRRDGRDCIKVLDFGISKSTNDDGDLVMTKTTSTIGTPLYMSPEQLKSSKNVDVRTDIWALGVILFELVSGRPPFRADSLAELGAKVLTTAAPDLRSFVPDAPAAFAEAIKTCLRRDLTRRFGSLADLANAIAPFGPPEAQASAARIAHVLANIPGPASASILPGSLDDAARTLDASSTFGISAESTWGSTTGLGNTEFTAPPPPVRESPRRAWVAAAILGVVAVGGVAGVVLGRNAKTAATTVTSEAVSAPPPPAELAPPTQAPTASATPAAAVAEPPTPATAPTHVATAPVRKAAAGRAATAPTAPKTASTPRATAPATKATGGDFAKGRFADD